LKSGFSDITFVSLTRSIVLLINLGLHSMLAWFLGPAGRGSYAVCATFLTVLGCLSLVGLNGAGNYYIASGKLSPSRSVSALLILGLVYGAIGVTLGLILVKLPLEFFSKASRTSFLITTAWVPFLVLELTLQGALAATKKFLQCGLSSIAGVCTQALGTFFLVGFFRYQAEGAVLSGMLGSVVSVSVALGFFVFRNHVQWELPSLSDLGQLIHYGMRYWLAELINLLHVQAAPLFLGLFASESELGMFAVGFGLVMRVTMIPDMITSVVQPRVAEDVRGRPELVTQSARIVGVLCCVILLLMGFFARQLVSLLFSPRFLASVALIWILAPGVAVRCTTKLILPYFNGTNRPGVQSFSTIAALASDLVGLTLLYPSFGLIGAGISGSISQMVNGAVLLIAFHKFSGNAIWSSWLPSRSDMEFLRKGMETPRIGFLRVAPRKRVN
jgi:O-antigen/teichoic acid export membrane protein